MTTSRLNRENLVSARMFQVGAFLAYLLLIVAYQWMSHAYTLPFAGYSDEPAHFMSSLMVRDYLLSGFSQTPLTFAEQYYVHYPAVAFGMWGPLLHVLGGLWMVVFSDSRVSILLFMAVIASSLAWSAQWLISREFGRVTGLLAGLALCFIPDLYVYSGLVMADILAGVFMFWAAYFWYRYMITEQTSMSVAFGVLAACAVLTKANPGVLVLLPIPSVLLTGKAHLLRRRSFWIPVPIVAILAGPWYVMWFRFMSNITRVPVTVDIAREFLVGIFAVFGLVSVPFVLAGMSSGFIKKLVPERQALWVVATVLTIAFIIYHTLVPGGYYEGRYVLMITPWVAVLSIFGVELASQIFKLRTRLPSALLWSLILAVEVFTFHVRPKTDLPYAEVVNYLLPQGKNTPQTIFLISSESSVETIFVSEVALHDSRPKHFVLRSSHMLARMNWNGDKYENTLPESQMMEQLQRWGVSRVVIDTTPGPRPWPHHRMLAMALSSDPQWHLDRRFGPLLVYAFQGPVTLPEQMEVDVPYTLQRTLKAKTRN